MQFDVGPELAARYGYVPELCAGVQFGDQPWRRAPYVVRAPGPRSSVTLRIKSRHDFGNLAGVAQQVTGLVREADPVPLQVVS